MREGNTGKKMKIIGIAIRKHINVNKYRNAYLMQFLLSFKLKAEENISLIKRKAPAKVK